MFLVTGAPEPDPLTSVPLKVAASSSGFLVPFSLVLVFILITAFHAGAYLNVMNVANKRVKHDIAFFMRILVDQADICLLIISFVSFCGRLSSRFS